jgi:hypothetical protein
MMTKQAADPRHNERAADIRLTENEEESKR